MKIHPTRLFPAVVLGAGLLLTACGGASQIAGTATADPAALAAAVAPAAPPTDDAPEDDAPAAADPATPAVATAEFGAFGAALVAADRRTLYGFTADADGIPTCVDNCANAWPALPADAGAVAGSGLDQNLLTVVDRPDGGQQLKYGKWPLYFYAGDGAPGDTLGQGIGDSWFLVAADGTLIKAAAAPAPGTTEAPAAEPAAEPAPEPAAEPAPEPAVAPEAAPAPAAGPVVGLATVGNLGEVMVGANGNTLYAFTDDTKTSTACVDACAAAWPPLTVEPGFVVSDELSQNGVSTLTRPDGSVQLVMGEWPLYYYAGDGQPGDALGQGIGGKWFAISAACTLVKTAA